MSQPKLRPKADNTAMSKDDRQRACLTDAGHLLHGDCRVPYETWLVAQRLEGREGLHTLGLVVREVYAHPCSSCLYCGKTFGGLSTHRPANSTKRNPRWKP